MSSLSTAEYQVDIIFQGYPGKAVCHGNLGWSTVSLLRGQQRSILLDTGSMGIRKELIHRLAQHGVSPNDITDLLLTHSHHDHSINWTLFSQARIFIGEIELNWALQQKWGATSVAELYMEELKDWPTLRTITDGETVLPGITAHLAPGHTPGSLIYRLHGREHDIIFTGDAAKKPSRTDLQLHRYDLRFPGQRGSHRQNLGILDQPSPNHCGAGTRFADDHRRWRAALYGHAGGGGAHMVW